MKITKVIASGWYKVEPDGIVDIRALEYIFSKGCVSLRDRTLIDAEGVSMIEHFQAGWKECVYHQTSL